MIGLENEDQERNSEPSLGQSFMLSSCFTNVNSNWNENLTKMKTWYSTNIFLQIIHVAHSIEFTIIWNPKVFMNVK